MPNRKNTGASKIIEHCTLLRESLEARNSHTKQVWLMPSRGQEFDINFSKKLSISIT